MATKGRILPKSKDVAVPPSSTKSSVKSSFTMLSPSVAGVCFNISTIVGYIAARAAPKLAPAAVPAAGATAVPMAVETVTIAA